MGLAAFNRMRRQNAEKAGREAQLESDNTTPAQAKQAAKVKPKKQAKQAETTVK